jgi:AraC family transcriptional regulator
LNYINQNLVDELSLETLAKVANYSTLHFRKIFTEAVYESPKQYIIRLRLEKAAHYLRAFRDMPISEVALNSGFTSPSIFSRSFRNYFGISAEELREMLCDEMYKISTPSRNKNKLFKSEDTDYWVRRICSSKERIADIQFISSPEIKYIKPIQVAYIQTTISARENISLTFKDIVKWAIPRDLLLPDSRFIGIWLDMPFYTSPDKCRYLAGIEIKTECKTNKGIDILTIPGRKYANFSMSGDMESTLDHILALNDKYINDMGYKINELICYELFNESPANNPYELINKNILLPVTVQ